MEREITSVQKSQEVSALLAVPNSRIIAGGTTFPQSVPYPLVDISGLEGLDGIHRKGSRIELGPLATLEALADSMAVKAYVPALAEAALDAGDPEVRRVGTLGGNLAAERIGDLAPVLLASGAKLTIRTDSDYRELLIDRFWGVGGTNDLAYDEWITRITIPVPNEKLWGAAFGKTNDWNLTTDPVAAAAVQLSLDDNDKVTAIRGGLRLGTKNIRRMFPLEKALKNQPATVENIENAVRSMAPAARETMTETEFSAFLKEILQRSLSMAEERRTL